MGSTAGTLSSSGHRITMASFFLACSLFLANFARAVPTVPRSPSMKFPYGAEKVRGVNLGGWFVLEPWITPSIFEPYATTNNVFDEYTLCEVAGQESANATLQQHWSSWITQSDFNKIAAAGLNHVRIPLGYWSVTPLPGDPYVQGAYEYLGQSLDWAQAAGLKVLIDLHGAPGSQNGFDNSGRRGAITWTQGDTISQTHAALNQIRDDHADHPAVAAIELVNEPMGPSLDLNTIQQFYYDGWGDLSNSPVAVTIHDAFEGEPYWNSWGNGLANVVLDTHHYEVFDAGQLAMSPSAHVSSACGFSGQMESSNKMVITGEWTGAMTDCAQWLNGLGVGARYDGSFNYNGQSSSYIGSCDGFSTGSVSQLSAADQTAIAQFVEAQMDSYEQKAGWIWWTWKTEGAPGWDMQDLLANGLFPQPVTSRKYPNQCGF